MGSLVNSKNVNGETPLHLAAYYGHEMLVRLLLENGADIEAIDASGETPLHKATARGKIGAAKALLSKNPDLDVRDLSHMTPLHRAVLANCTYLVRLLLNQGAQVNSRDIDENTPLHKTVERGYASSVGGLIARDKIAEGQREDRDTIICILLASDADTEAKNKFRIKPRNYAMGNGEEYLAQLLTPDGRLSLLSGEYNPTQMEVIISRVEAIDQAIDNERWNRRPPSGFESD